MSDDETFEINGEEFDGHRLYGPTHGEDLRIEKNGGSGTVPWKVRFRDIERLGDAVFPIAALQGDSFIYSDPMEHPYHGGLVAKGLRVTPYSPAEEEDDGDYRWAIATIEFGPPDSGDTGDKDKGGGGDLAGWKEQWKGAAQLIEKQYLYQMLDNDGNPTGTQSTRSRIDPYPLINLSITTPPFPKQPITRVKRFLSKINSDEFTSPSGVIIDPNELLYASFSADVSVIRSAGKNLAAWTLTNELLWRPVTGWLKDYGDQTGKLARIKTLDGSGEVYQSTALMELYKAS